MLSAGEMLATLPVVGEDWSGDAWAAFLDEYRLSREDGHWLSDLTDPFPLDVSKPQEVRMPEREVAGNAREDAQLLSPMLGIEDGQVAGPWFPVSGRWSIDRDTSASLTSVLASPADARSAAMTILADAPLFRSLPDDEDEIGRNFGETGHTIEEWVGERQNAERRLDRHDPYAATTAMSRPFPNVLTQQRLAAVADDPAVRQWSAAGIPVFRAEAWGAEGGRGEHAWNESGSHLSVDRNALLHLLRSTGRRLLVVLKLQKHLKSEGRGRGILSGGGFSHRSMVVIVDGNGRVWNPRRLSPAIRRTLLALGRDRDFYPRFRLIAGLPDERRMRRITSLDDPPQIEIVFKGLQDEGEEP